MDAVESVSCIGWPGAPCTDSGEHDGDVVRQEATPFSPSHKTLQTIQVTLVQEPPPCWRRVHESSNRRCPCKTIQGLTGHSSRSKGPQVEEEQEPRMLLT